MNNNEILVEQDERLAKARRDGLISSAIMFASLAVPFLIGFFIKIEYPSSRLALNVILLIVSIAGIVYMWNALKAIQDISQNEVFEIFKKSIMATFVIVGLAALMLFAKNNETIFSVLGLAVFIILIYVGIAWLRINLRLAKITQNGLFKTYVFVSIFCFVAVLFLRALPSFGLSFSLQTLIFLYMASEIITTIPLLVQIFAWRKVEKVIRDI
ncbi:hypothetical protein [Campylobacter sp. RM16188]|uniref:hypothetical protein n=1 Tax=Campylobacter sp. RM16188 TaxID=1705725 RepID=UPI001552C768|nr:hypothetical protein [Campylobacter sp. RM16188]